MPLFRPPRHHLFDADVADAVRAVAAKGPEDGECVLAVARGDDERGALWPLLGGAAHVHHPGVGKGPENDVADGRGVGGDDGQGETAARGSAVAVEEDNYKLQFNQFLVKDDEPLLFHTGMKGDFPHVREAVARVLDPATVRWLCFSHFESDECGSLNEWLQAAPQAQPLCTVVAALVNVSDFAIRASRWIPKEEVVNTGKYSFRLYPTHHLPHSWDAGMLFEETNRTLFCSDLFLRRGGGGAAHRIRRGRKSPEGDD